MEENNNINNQLSASLNGLNQKSKEAILMKQLENEETKLKKGYIDRLFGSINTRIYVAGLICILLMIIGIAVNLINGTSEHWKSIFPLVGTSIGYIMGKEIK